jgi:site-specific DNA-methyltransferase (adenine-specific)
MTPYYEDGTVSLYLGDCREVLPALGLTADLVLADPPYAETSLAWDRWPDGWPAVVAEFASSLWCFGSMRMFLDRRDEFADWRLSQDIVWEKHNGQPDHCHAAVLLQLAAEEDPDA